MDLSKTLTLEEEKVDEEFTKVSSSLSNEAKKSMTFLMRGMLLAEEFEKSKEIKSECGE